MINLGLKKNEHSFIFAPGLRIKDETKETSIREKAIEMIVKEGFDGLSMQKLAKEANVSPATIYLYFVNREDLLNRLYIEVEARFTETTLLGFDPNMHFEEGLWLQWNNRFNHITEFPFHFYFMEQFKNSHLIHHKDIKVNAFKETMRKFCHNAMERNEIVSLPVETFWSIAYGPFYSLVKFHLNQKSFLGQSFSLTKPKMKQAFDLVLKALKK